jgi:excisionase family DNA binding protein
VCIHGTRPEPILWTVNETAAMLNVSRSHLYRLVKDHGIPYVRLGRLMFSPRDVRDWVDSKRINIPS